MKTRAWQKKKKIPGHRLLLLFLMIIDAITGSHMFSDLMTLEVVGNG